MDIDKYRYILCSCFGLEKQKMRIILSFLDSLKLFITFPVHIL